MSANDAEFGNDRMSIGGDECQRSVGKCRMGVKKGGGVGGGTDFCAVEATL